MVLTIAIQRFTIYRKTFYIYEVVKTKMEKDDTLIGVVALILLVVVATAIVDTLDTKTDDIPADSQWNSAGNDLLKTLWLPVLAAIIIVVAWVLFRRDIGGGGV